MALMQPCMADGLTAGPLTLRLFDLADLRDLHAIFSDPLTHTIGEGPLTDLEQTRVWIVNRAERRARYGLSWYAVCLADETLIGNCGLFIGRTGPEPELGFEISHAHQGRGYATIAARAVVDEAHRAGFRTVWAPVRPNNAASLAALHKVGFQRDLARENPSGALIYLRHD